MRVARPDGTHRVEHVYAIDWDSPEDNVFLAVNQLPISGGNNRRPDILIYVNGLPLVLFELKNPYSIAPSEEEALNQIQHYTVDIPQVFEFNALCIVSDGVSTRHGVWTAIRLALGARPVTVLSMVLRESSVLVLAGVAVGVLAALALSRVVATLLLGVSSRDAAAFAGAVGVMAVVALLATILPARRAAKVDPTVALRYE